MRLIVEGYVIVSADGMLAESGSAHMPEVLRFAADQAFVTQRLADVDLVVRGRNSTDEFAGHDKRRQVIVTRQVATFQSEAANLTLWNPDNAPLEAACAAAGLHTGKIAVLGGPHVYRLFLDCFDAFYLSQAPRVRLPGGKGCFPGVPERTPQQILAAHGMTAAESSVLDAANGVAVTEWKRQTS